MTRTLPEFKEEFIKKYKLLLKDEIDTFLEYSVKRLPSVIRTNTIKTTPEELKKRLEEKGWVINNLKFYEPALVVKERDMPLGNSFEHFLGHFYVQESASMLPPLFLQPEKEDAILDTSAAPGSKTTQMSMMMENEGIIFANEPNLNRLSVLRTNCQRMGCKNIVTTRMDASRMRKTEMFDKVLVDAPCSAVGAMRKKWDIIHQWNPKIGETLSRLQKQILKGGIDACKKGGRIVYSTCTLEPEENEMVVDYAVKNLGVKIEKFEIKNFKTRNGITEWNNIELDDSLKFTHRVYPQDNDSEGFYVARLRKL